MKKQIMRGLVLYKKSGKEYVRIRFWMQGRRTEEFFGQATPESIQAAKRKLAEYRLKQTAGTLQQEMVERPVTVAEACDRYLQYKLTEPGSVREGATNRPSWDGYQRACQRFIKFLPQKYFHEVNVNDIRQYREWRSKNPLTRWQWKKGCFGQKENGRAVGKEVVVKGKISFSTINREQTVISNIFNVLRQLRATGEINFKLPVDNPCRYVTKPAEDSRRRTRVISVEEFERLMAHADHDLQFIVRFALVTMLRKGDLRALTKNNYRPITHTLEGVQSKTGLPFKVGIPKDLEEVVESSGGGPILNFTDFPRRWRLMIKKANLPGLQIRDLRRSAASWALKKSKDMALISATLGHRDIEMTQRYLGVISEARQDIANTLGELFADPDKIGAGDGNRTHVSALGTPHSTIEPHPHKDDDIDDASDKTVTQLYPKILKNSILPTEALQQQQELGKHAFYH